MVAAVCRQSSGIEEALKLSFDNMIVNGLIEDRGLQEQALSILALNHGIQFNPKTIMGQKVDIWKQIIKNVFVGSEDNKRENQLDEEIYEFLIQNLDFDTQSKKIIESLLNKDDKKNKKDDSDDENEGDDEDDILKIAEEKFGADALKKWKKKFKDQEKAIKKLVEKELPKLEKEVEKIGEKIEKEEDKDSPKEKTLKDLNNKKEKAEEDVSKMETKIEKEEERLSGLEEDEETAKEKTDEGKPKVKQIKKAVQALDDEVEGKLYDFILAKTT